MTRGTGHDGPGDRIVELSDHRGVAEHAAVFQVEDYWEQVRGGRLVPQRIEIDPKGLEGCLAKVFLIERISSGLARFRIAGSHMTELMGLEVRGMPMSSVFAPTSREKLADAIQSLFDDPAVVQMTLAGETGFGRPAIDGMMRLFPLRSDLGEISRALGVVSMSGRLGRAPRRLEITGQKRRGLVGYAGDDAASLRGFRETGVGYTPAKSPAQQSMGRAPQDTAGARRLPPYLRLVTDNT